MTDTAIQNDRSQGEKLARSLEITNLTLAAIAVIVTHLVAGSGPMFYGVIAGALIGTLNLRSMVWLTRKLIAAEAGSRARYGLLFAVKLILVGSIVWVVLSQLPIHSMGFVIGFSSLLPSALWVAFLRSLEPAAKPQVGADQAKGRIPGKSRYATHQEQRS